MQLSVSVHLGREARKGSRRERKAMEEGRGSEGKTYIWCKGRKGLLKTGCGDGENRQK